MNGIYKTLSIGGALQKSLAEKLNKEEFLTLKLICDWKMIVQEFATYTKPMRLYIKQEMMLINVQPGYAMAIQYQNEKICNLINAYLGKKYITHLMVKTSMNINQKR